MPTTATHTYTLHGLNPVMDPDNAKFYPVKLPNSVTYAQGTVLGQISATRVFKAYTSGASDGSQLPKAILKYSVITDSSGNIIPTSTVGQSGGEQGETMKYAEAYFSGTFSLADLVASGAGSIDATAFTNNPSWNLIEGNLGVSTVLGTLRIG